MAFYASTLAYRMVLDRHGWGERQSILHPMSKASRWEAMGEVIDDQVLEAFATIGDEKHVAADMSGWCQGVVGCTRISTQSMPMDGVASFFNAL